jgi:hypothetical protein
MDKEYTKWHIWKGPFICAVFVNNVIVYVVWWNYCMDNTIIFRNGTSAFKDCRTMEHVSVHDEWFIQVESWYNLKNVDVLTFLWKYSELKELLKLCI